MFGFSLPPLQLVRGLAEPRVSKTSSDHRPPTPALSTAGPTARTRPAPERRGRRPQRAPPGRPWRLPGQRSAHLCPRGRSGASTRHQHLPPARPRRQRSGGKRRPRAAGKNGHLLSAPTEHLRRDRRPRSAPAAHVPGPAPRGAKAGAPPPHGLAPARAARANPGRPLRPRAAEPGAGGARPPRGRTYPSGEYSRLKTAPWVRVLRYTESAGWMEP